MSRRLVEYHKVEEATTFLGVSTATLRDADDSLEKRESELTDFLENANVSLHKVGADGRIIWANRAECELLGYSLDEYIGRSIADFHADADVIETILQKLSGGETLEDFPARLRAKDGSIKHVLISSSACFEDGKFAYTRCFTRDVTNERRAEKALLETDRRKDEFLATLAHELRNPLAPIRNALEMMRVSGADPTIADEARGILDRQVRQMVRLVDDLLDVSRVTRDKLVLRKERVELAAVVRAALETSQPAIDALSHALHISLPDEPVYVDADPTRLAQVLSNLLNNSAKYTDAGGNIELTTRCEDGEVVLSVRDNGVGISCSELAYIFEIFRQADRTLERTRGGLGIGLTLVRRLVELHGGSVAALSEGAGKGSEFIVRLPLAKAPATEAVAAHGATTSSPTNKRVLVVDDNLDSCGTMSMLLKLRGYDVRMAHDGLEAIEQGGEFHPDVILMDVGMPNLNGFDATRCIRQLPWGKDICIIALTGWGQESDLRHSVEAGCTAHLVKPVDFMALERLVGSYSVPG